jgi:hypothetical protein
MTEIGLLLLGAALTLVTIFLIEWWKLIRASHTAAFLVLRKLEFHEIRLALSIKLDEHPDATYELRFPLAAWSADRSALLSGAPFRDAEPILNWYATMTVLGFVLARMPGPHGPQISGPERGRLQDALSCAHDGAQRITGRRRKLGAARGCLESFSVGVGIPCQGPQVMGNTCVLHISAKPHAYI